MPESSSETTRLTVQRRAAALLGLVALVMLQVSVAAHQFQHVADHGFSVCQVCSTQNQLDDAPVSAAQHVALPVSSNATGNTGAEPLVTTVIVAPYRSRAPPHC